MFRISLRVFLTLESPNIHHITHHYKSVLLHTFHLNQGQSLGFHPDKKARIHNRPYRSATWCHNHLTILSYGPHIAIFIQKLCDMSLRVPGIERAKLPRLSTFRSLPFNKIIREFVWQRSLNCKSCRSLNRLCQLSLALLWTGKIYIFVTLNPVKTNGPLLVTIAILVHWIESVNNCKCLWLQMPRREMDYSLKMFLAKLFKLFLHVLKKSIVMAVVCMACFPFAN